MKSNSKRKAGRRVGAAPLLDHTIADADIIGYGTAAVKTSAGLMHVIIRSGSPTFKRLEKLMRSGRSLWSNDRTERQPPTTTVADTKDL